MAIDRLVRLAVPADLTVELLVEVGNGAGAGFGHAAADDQPVGVETMHGHAALRPVLEIVEILLDVGASLLDAGAGQVRERLTVVNRNVPALEDLAVAGGADEADRPAKLKQRRDPRLAAG